MAGTGKPRKGWNRRGVRLTACLALLATAVWVFGYATGPAREVAQLTVLRPGGPPAVLTLWEADPLVPVPGLSTPARQVRFAGGWRSIHPRGNGNGVGPVLVAPDGSRAWVTGTYHGRVNGGVLVDLTTGAMRWANGRADVCERAGWQPRYWRTALEPRSTAEVLAVAREASPERFKLALDELHARGFTADDWPAYAAALLDPTFPAANRPALAYTIAEAGETDFEDPTAFAGLWLDDPDPRVRLCAAWAVAQLAGGPGRRAPPEFDPVALWQAEPAERERVVAEVRAWWRGRPLPWRQRNRPATTAPSGRDQP